MPVNLLTANVTSCPGTTTYQWTKNGTPVGTGATLVPNGPGIYAVIVECSSSPDCTDTENITLNCDPMSFNISQTTGDITANHLNCSSPTITWTGPGGFSATGATITPNAGNGTYTATIVCGTSNSQQGCIETANFSCNFTTEIVNTSGTLSTTNTPVSPFTCASYTYLWTSPTGGTSTSSTVSANANGTWSVVVTCAANGCIATDTIVVAQDCDSFVPNLSSGGGQLTITPGPSCSDVDVSWTGPGGFTSTSNPVTPNNGNGVYTANITCDDNGLDDSCTATRTFTCDMFTNITQQISGDLIANVTSSNCSSFSYSWSGPSGFTGSTQVVTPVNTGTYTVTVTCTTSGCIATNTFNYVACTLFNVVITPNLAANTLTANVTGCGGTATFLWSTGATTQTISPSLDDGEVTYTVTATCGTCTDSASHTVERDTIFWQFQIVPNAITLESLIINGNDVITSNQSLLLGGGYLTFPAIEGFIQTALGSNGYSLVRAEKQQGVFNIRIVGALISGFNTSNTFGNAIVTATANSSWFAATLTLAPGYGSGNPLRTFTRTGLTTSSTQPITAVGASYLTTLPINFADIPANNVSFDITNNATHRANLKTLLENWLSARGYVGTVTVSTDSIIIAGTDAIFFTIRQDSGFELPRWYYSFNF